MKEWLGQTKLLPPESDCPAQNPPHHISPAFVAGDCPVRQCERQASSMIRHHTEGDIMPKLLIRRLKLRSRSIRLAEICRRISCP